MTVLYATLIILVSVVVILNTYRYIMLNKVRRNVNVPPTNKFTMFDVRRLLMEGKKDLAIKVYGEIFNVVESKAKNDVEELQRSLKV